MASSHIDLTQINMHHSKAAAASLCGHRDRVVRQKHNYIQHAVSGSACSVNSFIFLIQEPYHYKGAIRGLGSKDQLFWGDTKDPPRACVLISKNVTAQLLSEFLDRDVLAFETKWESGSIVVASIYMPGDSVTPPPSERSRNLVAYCERKAIPLVIGADANSHHLLWGSSGINSRGEQLLEYLMTTDL